jgi:2,3-bisphosphoglycerate-dependent phosphoglycerate mutase
MTKEYHQTVYSPPKGAADLLLIRHGQTEPARPGYSFPMVDGHGDPALHPNGEAQAIAVGEFLKADPIDAIYVTTLRRTHQTAAPLAAHLGLVPVVEADLREVCLGEWDGGLYRIKAVEKDPRFVRANQMQEWGEIPGAETTAIVHDRVRAGLLRIAARHADQRVAVVVHGGVIGAASRIVVLGDKMSVKGFNDSSHLT